MNLEKFIELLEALEEGKKVLVPAQLHIRGQIEKLKDAFGSYGNVAAYLKKVLYAEDFDYQEIK